MNMKASGIAILLGVAAAVTGFSSHADSYRKKGRDTLRTDSGMRTIANPAKPGQPAHHWRYFADTREGRAVVISPAGDYFYSDGAGLSLVHKGTGAPGKPRTRAA